jgi:hypothetical protein
VMFSFVLVLPEESEGHMLRVPLGLMGPTGPILAQWAHVGAWAQIGPKGRDGPKGPI